MYGMSRMISMRVPDDVDERLARAASGGSRSALAVRLIDEGLRMEAHPGIVFRPGPAGRRAALSDGPDVWEMARVVRETGSDETGLAEAAELTGRALRQMRIVAGYYSEFKAEIDGWLARVDELADRLDPA